MKKINLTTIIILSGIAAALCMLCNAYLPGVFKSLSSIAFMFVMFGIALVLTPNKKPTKGSFTNMLATLFVAGVVFTLFDTIDSIGYLKIPVFALIGALGMILRKQDEYALCTAVYAASAASYCGGNTMTYVLLSLAFCVFAAAINMRKIKCFPVKAAAAFLICLALCAFK